MATYHHVGISVPEIGAAIAELSDALGLTFQPVKTARFGSVEFPLTYSVEGPPFIELMEQADGAPFPALGLDHVGVQVSGAPQTHEQLERAGFVLEVDGALWDLPFRYYRGGRSHLRVEVIDDDLFRQQGRGWSADPGAKA